MNDMSYSAEELAMVTDKDTTANKKKQSDLEFLKEMKGYFDKCDNSNDVVSREMLGRMIDDWIDELADKK